MKPPLESPETEIEFGSTLYAPSAAADAIAAPDMASPREVATFGIVFADNEGTLYSLKFRNSRYRRKGQQWDNHAFIVCSSYGADVREM
jgi:hypothetical protein